MVQLKQALPMPHDPDFAAATALVGGVMSK